MYFLPMLSYFTFNFNYLDKRQSEFKNDKNITIVDSHSVRSGIVLATMRGSTILLKPFQSAF